MSGRRYRVPGCPGVVVYRIAYSGESQWTVDDDGQPRTDVVEAAIVHAGESEGPWETKRAAVEDVQTSYDLHKEYFAAEQS